MTLEPLTREDVVAGLQCKRRLYLQRGPIKLNAPFTEHNLEHVRKIAHLRFSGGQLLRGDFQARLEATRKALSSHEPVVLFDACALHKNVAVELDILCRTQGGEIHIYAIRCSSTVKRATYNDLAVDVWALRGCGQAPTRANVLHINPEYCLESSGLDPHRLFSCVEAFSFLENRITAVEDRVAELQETLELTEEPCISVGAHCRTPARCPFLHHCTPRTGPFHVSRIPHGTMLAQRLSHEAIEDIRIMPEPTRMSPVQRRAIACLQNGDDWVGPGLQGALDSVQFPLGFLDFEAVASPIPLHPNTYPHQSLPTQWSLHIQAPDGTLTHKEFIHDENTDPREAFVKSLLSAVRDVRSLVVYSPAEAQTLRALAEHLPQHAEALMVIRSRLHDLLGVIRRHYYHPDFNGTYTLKRVLPCLVSDLDYNDLEIRDGATASLCYPRLFESEPTSASRAAVRDSLLRYCRRDTLALVRIREVLLERCTVRLH